MLGTHPKIQIKNIWTTNEKTRQRKGKRICQRHTSQKTGWRQYITVATAPIVPICSVALYHYCTFSSLRVCTGGAIQSGGSVQVMNLWQTMLISSIVPSKLASKSRPKPWATLFARNLCLAFFFVASYVCLASGIADRTISEIRIGSVLVGQR